MRFRWEITPQFNAKEIINETVGKDWFILQNELDKLGRQLLQYMKSYIILNTYRKGGFTGNLAGSIDYNHVNGMGTIWWGIGDLVNVQKRAPYWYVLNYGKKVTGEPFVPGGGKYKPVRFQDGDANPALKGVGTSPATDIRMVPSGGTRPTVIRPINYIQATEHQMDMRIEAILNKLREM